MTNSIVEEWKDIKGYEGIYKVSNLGRIRSEDRYIVMSHGGVKFQRGRIMRGSYDSSGYRRVTLTNIDKEPKSHRIHRVVAEYFVPNPDNYSNVNFISSDREDLSATNLIWVPSNVSNSKGGFICYQNKLEREGNK